MEVGDLPILICQTKPEGTCDNSNEKALGEYSLIVQSTLFLSSIFQHSLDGETELSNCIPNNWQLELVAKATNKPLLS